MKKFIFLVGILLLLCTSVLAQANKSASSSKSQNRSNDRSAAGAAASIAGRAGVIVIKSAAKVGWETTKFAVKDVAAPAAKGIFLKALPKASIYLLKNSGAAAKVIAPLALKLSLL